MNSHWTRMLMMTAVLAIATAQLLGIQQGYICDCGGQVQITMADHCHGPHGVECHELELTKGACREGSSQHESSSGTNEHGEHLTSLLAKPVSNQFIQVFSPMSQLLPMDVWLSLMALPSMSVTRMPAWSAGFKGSDPPLWAERLAHVIALRV